MGIFSNWNNKDDKQAHSDAFLKSLEKHSDRYVREIYTRLADYKSRPAMAVMKPFYLYTDCLEMMFGNLKDFKPEQYFECLDYAEEIYKAVFAYEEQTPNFDELCLIFIELFDEDSAVAKHCFNQTFYNLFTDKHNYIKWLRGLAKYKNIAGKEKYYVPYGVKARAFFFDEDQFTAHMVDITTGLLVSSAPAEFYAKALIDVEHMAGIYNVDETRILNLEQHIAATEGVLERSMEILNAAEARLQTIDSVTKTAYDSVKSLCDQQLTITKSQLADLADKMQLGYDEFVEGQRKVVLYEKQQLLDSVFRDAEDRMKDMQKMAQTTVSGANMELMKISQESGLVMNKVHNLMRDDKQLQEMMKNLSKNSELIGKLDKLMLLNEQEIAQMQKNVEAAADRQAAEPEVRGNAAQAKSTKSSRKLAAEGEESHGREEIPEGVNPLLDESVPFKTRWKFVMNKKTEMAAAGEHFHEKFDDVVTAVMENANPYLIGPSGCGKTYLVGQVAKVLGLEFIDIGYINEEYDILGFQTADGGYSTPNFYRCYKYGKIAFCDELDNGNSRATVKLNSFLSNTTDASYNFPHGENVKRHPNFRIIGAGNTAGNGADSNYNTREKIEESVQQRFLPIYMGYDNAVEKIILKDYPNWFAFLERFRKATDAWAMNSYSDAPGTITTRDAARIKRYLDNGSFDMGKILDYEFIQTKDPGYLAFLSNEVTRDIKKNMADYEIAWAFARKVDAIRKNPT